MRLCILGFVCSLVLTAAPLGVGERQRLVAHLEMTQSWLDLEVTGLTPAQLKFQPGEGKWSILDVVEHLTLAEPVYWRQFQDALKVTPPAGKKTQASDADILWYGVDRTQHQKTEPAKEPKRELRDLAAGLDAFHKLHAEMLQYARSTQEDLRSHLVEGEGVDDYQWILMISTHEQRHILQILEIKADPKFPKS